MLLFRPVWHHTSPGLLQIQVSENEEIPGSSNMCWLRVYAWLQRHSHGRIHLSIANAKSLVKHSFFSLWPDFSPPCFLSCASMQTEKGFLNISCQLPSSSTVRHRNPSANPRKMSPSLSLFLFSIYLKFTFRYPASGSSPKFCCFRCWPSTEEESAAMPITQPSIKLSGTGWTLSL